MSSPANDHRPSVSASLYSRLMASEAALPEVYTTAEPPFVITFANLRQQRVGEAVRLEERREGVTMLCG